MGSDVGTCGKTLQCRGGKSPVVGRIASGARSILHKNVSVRNGYSARQNGSGLAKPLRPGVGYKGDTRPVSHMGGRARVRACLGLWQLRGGVLCHWWMWVSLSAQSVLVSAPELHGVCPMVSGLVGLFQWQRRSQLARLAALLLGHVHFLLPQYLKP
jgi:hypothetical protein